MINKDKLKTAAVEVVKWTGTVVALTVFATLLYTFVNTATESNDKKLTDATVMITNMEGNSGGSGVVVSIGNNESEILTNSHVCGLLKSGGKVTTTYGESHVAKYYKQDTDHDLCLVVVAAKLRTAAKIATNKPTLLEDAKISGHPNLLPEVITRGHFTGNKVIQVFTGVEKCTTEDEKDEKLGMFCWFFGGIPMIKAYEATVVTALIMPGSSGSAVYNSNDEVSGLAFAGNQGMSYAFVVPFEYVTSFLSKNLGGKNRDKFDSPDYKLNIRSLILKEEQRKKSLLKKCEKIENNILIEDMCKVIVDTIKWRS